jgi:hypothetical protein
LIDNFIQDAGGDSIVEVARSGFTALKSKRQDSRGQGVEDPSHFSRPTMIDMFIAIREVA